MVYSGGKSYNNRCIQAETVIGGGVGETRTPAGSHPSSGGGLHTPQGRSSGELSSSEDSGEELDDDELSAEALCCSTKTSTSAIFLSQVSTKGCMSGHFLATWEASVEGGLFIGEQ